MATRLNGRDGFGTFQRGRIHVSIDIFNLNSFLFRRWETIIVFLLTYETDVAARKPRAEYTRGLTIVGEAWDYMGNLTKVVYSISFVY